MSTIMLGILGIVALGLLTCLTFVLQAIVAGWLTQAAKRDTCAQDDENAYELDGELFTAEEFTRLMELHTAYQHTRTGGDAA